MTHPLERLKRIANPDIRKQAIENFSQEYYKNRLMRDIGDLPSAINWTFNWRKSPQGYDYWRDIYQLAKEGKLELLPEPIEGDDFYCKTKYSENFLCEEQCDACKKADELTIPEPIEDNPTLGDKTSLANVYIYEQNTQLKLENEKLRECQIPEELKDFVNEAMYVINLKKDKRYTNAELSKQKLFEMFEDILYKI